MSLYVLDRPFEHTCVVGGDVAACAGIVSIVVTGLPVAIKCRDSLQSGPRWRILHVASACLSQKKKTPLLLSNGSRIDILFRQAQSRGLEFVDVGMTTAVILAHRLSLRQAARCSWAAEMEGQQQHACRCDCPSLTSPNKQVERQSRTGGKQRCHTWLRKMEFWFVDLVMQGRRCRFTSGREKKGLEELPTKPRRRRGEHRYSRVGGVIVWPHTSRALHLAKLTRPLIRGPRYGSVALFLLALPNGIFLALSGSSFTESHPALC